METSIARQPIFDREMSVIAYELLHRSSEVNEFQATDGSVATRQVVAGALFSVGFEKLVRGKIAFINFDHSLLLSSWVTTIPRERVVIEVLESVCACPEALIACSALAKQGYTVALDDFVEDEANCALIASAQILKIDIRTTSPDDQRRLIERYKPRGMKLLAEKVETHEEFDQAHALGYDYFQGYFFGRPAIVKGRAVPPSTRGALRLLKELAGDAMDFEKLEAVIRSDVTLSWKLLRYVNSSMFTLRAPVSSIGIALSMLGEVNIRRFLTIALFSEAASGKPLELLAHAQLRARFAELLAIETSLAPPEDAFLAGLFSMLPALLDRSMTETLADLTLKPEIADSLLGTTNSPSSLARLMQVALQYAEGDWYDTFRLATSLNLTIHQLSSAYAEAVLFADSFVAAIHT